LQSIAVTVRGSEGLEQKRVRRATKDVDFAVVLPDWRAFAQLKGHLIRDHGFADEARQQHRLVFRAEGPGCGTPIDLVPFGGLLLGSGRSQ